MDLPTLDSSALPSGETVLVRADFNVPLEDGRITDDRRIKATLPTMEALREAGQRIVVCAHLGRPGGEYDASLSFGPVAERLGELLGADVALGPRSVVGEEAEAAASELQDGDVLLLENLRFHPGERDCADDLVDGLVRLADGFVNDAFAACHRAHASVVGPPQHLPSAAGQLVQREVEVLLGLRDDPRRPFIGLLGGAKVADKLDVVEALLERCDRILVGGAMCFTFLAADGRSVGASPVEEEAVDRCRELLRGGAIELPTDLVVAEAVEDGADHRVESVDDVPEGWVGADIGPDSSERFGEILRDAASVFWNGPMGVFEIDAFAEGSRQLARVLAESDGLVVVGGGDTGAAVEGFGLSERIDHISTGGGASLELLAEGDLPGLRALREATSLSDARPAS